MDEKNRLWMSEMLLLSTHIYIYYFSPVLVVSVSILIRFRILLLRIQWKPFHAFTTDTSMSMVGPWPPRALRPLSMGYWLIIHVPKSFRADANERLALTSSSTVSVFVRPVSFRSYLCKPLINNKTMSDVSRAFFSLSPIFLFRNIE